MNKYRIIFLDGREKIIESEYLTMSHGHPTVCFYNLTYKKSWLFKRTVRDEMIDVFTASQWQTIEPIK